MTISQIFTLAVQHHQAGRLAEAEALYRQVLAAQPDHAEAWHQIGAVTQQVGRLDLAERCLRRTLQLQPFRPRTYFDLGNILASSGRLDEAENAFRRAMDLAPDRVEPMVNLGNILRARGRIAEAEAVWRRVLEISPRLPEVRHNLGLVFAEQGRFEEAIAAYRRAIALRPDHAAVRNNLISTFHRYREEDDAVVTAEERIWNEQFFEPWKTDFPPHANGPDPERRMKIGYVSPDFRFHPISFFLAPLLEAHDRKRHEIYCYADVRRPDAVTTRLRAAVDVWRDVRPLTDGQLAECIRNDGVDILVDLAMRTTGNRLLAFARRPAPVQVSWLAYPGSTGCEAIDYRFTDARLDPVEERAGLGGEAVRFPDSWCCYAPIEEFPEVNALPAAARGGVTFGSLNQFEKINEELLRCWAKLLLEAPAARLLMICPEGRARDRVRAVLSSAGIAPERLEFVEICPWVEYVRLFGRMDVALDSYPCNGMTTTCHSLWMGVPVVTRAGRSATSRAGRSLLHTMGLPECIADNEEDYIRIAAELAGDRQRLAKLRRTLRPRMLASPLMDAPRFARHVESAYRAMWERWCAQKKP